VLTKIYILSCAHVSFKINISLVQTTCPPEDQQRPPEGAGPTVWEPLHYRLYIVPIATVEYLPSKCGNCPTYLVAEETALAWRQKLHCCVHWDPSWATSATPTFLRSILCKIHSNITLPPTCRSQTNLHSWCFPTGWRVQSNKILNFPSP
jgi:hypothetical protein